MGCWINFSSCFKFASLKQVCSQTAFKLTAAVSLHVRLHLDSQNINYKLLFVKRLILLVSIISKLLYYHKPARLNSSADSFHCIKI